MIRTACGWAFFAIILASSLGPCILLVIPGPEVDCSKTERRLVWENYQPRTELVRVCEVK